MPNYIPSDAEKGLLEVSPKVLRMKLLLFTDNQPSTGGPAPIGKLWYLKEISQMSGVWCPRLWVTTPLCPTTNVNPTVRWF
jgi:hypothetical protein